MRNKEDFVCRVDSVKNVFCYALGHRIRIFVILNLVQDLFLEKRLDALQILKQVQNDIRSIEQAEYYIGNGGCCQGTYGEIKKQTVRLRLLYLLLAGKIASECVVS